MAINELNPKARFSRDSMLLVGIWQGEGKPQFKQYLECLSEQYIIVFIMKGPP